MITLLIAEDDVDLIYLFKKILLESDYHLLMATSSQTVFDLIEVNDIDVVLLDIMLGEDDGREICRRIKGDTMIKHLPVILMSASSIALNNWRQHGANDALPKPFDLSELHRKIAVYAG